jgi:hypothetical protein
VRRWVSQEMERSGASAEARGARGGAGRVRGGRRLGRFGVRERLVAEGEQVIEGSDLVALSSRSVCCASSAGRGRAFCSRQSITSRKWSASTWRFATFDAASMTAYCSASSM